MLTRGSAEYDPLPREAAWIDVRPLKDVLRDLPKPRVLATHVPLSYLPNNFRFVCSVLFSSENINYTTQIQSVINSGSCL